PKKQQDYGISFLLGFFDFVFLAFSRKRGFKSKILVIFQKFVNSSEHYPPCFKSNFFGLERRKSFCYFVCIDKFFTIQNFRQNSKRSCCFSCSVTACNYVKFFV